MRQLVMIVFSCLAFASSALAEPHRDWVRGDIRSVNGNLIRIDDTDVKLASDVSVRADTGDGAAPALAVGQNVTAVVEDGLVTRVEITAHDRHPRTRRPRDHGRRPHNAV